MTLTIVECKFNLIRKKDTLKMIKSIKKQSTQLLIGYTISGLGDQFYTFAIPLLMLTRSHSSITMGLLTAMEYLPTALFGIIIGSIFDIFSRKNIMLYSLLMQSILILETVKFFV
ncbi:MFS transporter [Lactobacillus helveticus]|nr:MFS transporter [Lactobacillus helveticus]